MKMSTRWRSTKSILLARGEYFGLGQINKSIIRQQR